MNRLRVTPIQERLQDISFFSFPKNPSQAGLSGAQPFCDIDQSCQFTNEQYIGLLKEQKVAVSMDGKGRALDNIPIERFFRSLTYEEICLLNSR